MMFLKFSLGFLKETLVFNLHGQKVLQNVDFLQLANTL